MSQAAYSTASMKPDYETRGLGKAFIDVDRETQSAGPAYAAPAAVQEAKSVAMVDSDSTYSSDQSSTSQLKRSPFEETESYDELRRLGHGGNGNCFLLKRQRDSVLRVCKVCRSKPEHISRTPVEAYILQKLLPPYERIVHMHELIMTPHTIQIYLDYYDGGDLGQFMDKVFKDGMRLEENFVWHCYQQLCEALAYIHTGYKALSQKYETPLWGDSWTPIIHGDIKPMNIFVKLSTRNCFPELVLGDFGNSQIRPGRYLIGTLPWQPPEVPEYSVQSDVWGAGAIVHAMCHGGRPPMRPLPSYCTRTRSALKEWELMPVARQCTPLGREYSSELNSCLRFNMEWRPNDRPSSNELLLWVNGYVEDRYRWFSDWHTIACKASGSQTSNLDTPVPFSFFSDDSPMGDEQFSSAQSVLDSQGFGDKISKSLAEPLDEVANHLQLSLAHSPSQPEFDQKPNYLGSLPDCETYWFLDAQGQWYTKDQSTLTNQDEDLEPDDYQNNEPDHDAVSALPSPLIRAIVKTLFRAILNILLWLLLWPFWFYRERLAD